MYSKVAEGGLKCCGKRKESHVMQWEVLANAVVIIALQYVSVASQRTVHLHFTNVVCQLYLSKA